MLENILGRKFELHPVELKENQIHCDFCGGTGWVLKDGKWLESCPRCSFGAIDVCSYCKTPYEKRYIHHCKNPECVEKARKFVAEKAIEEEERRYANAAHLEPTRDFEALICDAYSYNEGCFFDWDDFFDDWGDNHNENDPRPKYAWAVIPVQIGFDAGCLVESATDDLWEGAMDSISDDDMAELQALLDEWCKKQTGTTTYYPDYKKAVRIPWEWY